MRQEPLWAGFQITRSPVARLRKRSIQRPTHNHHLRAVQAAYPRLHHMHIHAVLAPWPLEWDVVACRQLSGILRQLLPAPPLGNARVCYRQPAVALDARRDQEVALTSRSPETLGAV